LNRNTRDKNKQLGKNFAVFIVGADLRVCPGVTSYTAAGAPHAGLPLRWIMPDYFCASDYNQRFTDSGRRIFARVLNGARGRGQNYVVVEHFIEALCAEEERPFRLLAGLLKIDLNQVQTMWRSVWKIFHSK
jgi:hypothetical protein